jgi:indolepyruvate ferredoxin oxidoreductase beta subunit
MPDQGHHISKDENIKEGAGMKQINIYLTGVGGQGIGLLAEIILRAADHAGLMVKGVDTHGLAQRGGIVASQIRIGELIQSPLIEKHAADMVVALERNEALRASGEYLKTGGTLVYYDVVWQPLPVRLNLANEVDSDALFGFCTANGIKAMNVFAPFLTDPRMQNIALLACICSNNLIVGISKSHYLAAMDDLMAGAMYEKNMAFFETEYQKYR